MGRLKNLVFGGLAFLAVGMGLVLYLHNSVFILDGPDNGFLLTKSESVRYSFYLPAFYIHIVTGSIVLIAGIFQLSKSLREHYPRGHRLTGKLYVFILLIFTAPSGLVMSFCANGGIAARSGFAILAMLWWFFTWKGFRHITQQHQDLHREFMIRSYALTFAAVTLRLYSFFFALAGMRGEFIYSIIVWLSWVPSLIVVELWLQRRAQHKKRILS